MTGSVPHDYSASVITVFFCFLPPLAALIIYLVRQPE